MARRKVLGASRNIHKRNFLHYMFSPYTGIFWFNYYGKVEIKGLENIPRGEPVIFAPNHTNALMDALNVLFSAPQDMVFLARADIFNSPFLAYFMNSMKILPVFRQRDGAQELGKNEDIFDIAVDVLKHKHYLCVMPEGNHGHQRKLRAFGKGIFRIAFAAQKEKGVEPFVKIVPVGLDFGDYVKHSTSLFVNYGEPIEVSDYWEQYEEGAPRAINAAKNDLVNKLKPQMIHIETDEYYETVYLLKGIFNDSMRAEMGIEGSKLSDRFVADKEIIARVEAIIAEDAAIAAEDAAIVAEDAAIVAGGKEIPAAKSPGRMAPLAEKIERYTSRLKEMNIRDWVVSDKGYGSLRSLWRFLSLLLSFPFFVFGFLTNALPYFLPVYLARNIKDRQFISSVKAALGIYLTFPIWYALTTLVVGLLTGTWWIWVVYLLSLLPMGKLALKWSFRWKKTLRGSWFARKLKRKDAAAEEMVALRDAILDDTKNLIF